MFRGGGGEAEGDQEGILSRAHSQHGAQGRTRSHHQEITTGAKTERRSLD